MVEHRSLTTTRAISRRRAYRGVPARPAARIQTDDALGMAWWNGLSKLARLTALQAADSAVPAAAWAYWRLRQSAELPREVRL